MRHRTSKARRPLALTSTLLVISAGFAGHTASAAIASAARNADVDAVRKLISSGTDVNAPEADGTSALLWATYQSSPELVSMLLAAGANPNAANNFGVTPLLQAARTGDASVVSLLLKGGADVAHATREGETPLMAAARSGSLDAVKVLLDNRADPNAVEAIDEQTALMWATSEGHLDIVDALLDAGANPNLKARASELTKRSSRTDFPSGGFTALMWAVRDGNEPIVRRLVEGGADLNVTNADGATAMMLAIVNDRFDLAAELLKLGADANDGSLYQATEMRDSTTDWRAKDGSRLRVDHPNELTALDLTRILLEAGADPNKPYSVQMHSASMCCDTKPIGTPFFRAAISADVEGLKLMIAHGADLEWMPPTDQGGPPAFGGSKAGKTPLMVAMNGGKGVGMAGGPGDIREGAKPPFREVGNREPVDAVNALLEAGANPNALSSEGDSALHLAAWDGKLDIVRALVAGGADLNLKDAAGKTPLQIVENQPPRPAGPTSGALAGEPQGAQPTEVAALLRELASGNVQANAGGASQ